MPKGSEHEQRGIPPEFAAKALVDQGIDSLLAELAQGRSQRLEDYLTFTARFHRYSLNNQILIYMQRPDATYVAGYRTWQEMGYQVAGGQKGIRIQAPRPYKRKNRETGEEEEAITFATVSVFDASQLANLAERPLPAFFTPLADDQGALFARLAQVVTEDGIIITEQRTGLAQGYSTGGSIALKAGMDSRNKVLVLIHEYAHELLHWGGEGKEMAIQVKECHAEAVSYVVAHHFGMDNPFSSDYLHHWGTTPKELVAELEVIRRAAAYIIDRIEEAGSQP
ncbi:MAG: hypothetical protein EXR62_07760 [Chloroflexi bacterium]|nr:hypothetical protein [Chloroflexota bacterium]